MSGPPKNTPILWLPESLEDIERLHGFLLEKSPVAAARAAHTILQGTRILEETPHAGRPMADQTSRRELFVAFGAGAYVLRYRLDPAHRIVILRVWHSREAM